MKKNTAGDKKLILLKDKQENLANQDYLPIQNNYYCCFTAFYQF